jgi:uncharacterized protein
MLLIAAALLVVLAGVGIGATSIGGVLVVPALTAVAGVPIASAVAASSLGFVMTGAWTFAKVRADVGATYAAHIPMFVAALVGAILGAYLVQQVPATWVRAWIGVLALASGIHAFATAGRADSGKRNWPQGIALIVIGAIVGVGSALSGTGGPVMLLPILLLYGIPTAPAIATALAIQLPIALSASATHMLAGTIDYRLGLGVGLAMIGGVWLGQRIARRFNAVTLRRAVAIVLIAIGLWYALA